MDEDGDDMDEDHKEESACNKAAAAEGEIQSEASTATTEDKEGAPARTEDVHFLRMFGEDDMTCHNIAAISERIGTTYEQVSGLGVVVRKRYDDSRTYCCSSHVGCCFKAKFGPKRGTKMIILKKKNSVLYHCGNNVVRIQNVLSRNV
jgi:hypothetical protein